MLMMRGTLQHQLGDFETLKSSERVRDKDRAALMCYKFDAHVKLWSTLHYYNGAAKVC